MNRCLSTSENWMLPLAYKHESSNMSHSIVSEGCRFARKLDIVTKLDEEPENTLTKEIKKTAKMNVQKQIEERRSQ